jgi:hypothetical protein
MGELVQNIKYESRTTLQYYYQLKLKFYTHELFKISNIDIYENLNTNNLCQLHMQA